MPAAISLDLRQRIVEAVERGDRSQPLIAEEYGVSRTTVVRILARRRQGKPLQADKPRGLRKKLETKHNNWLRRTLEKRPFLNSHELTILFCKKFPERAVHRSTILRAMHALDLSYKKNFV